MKSRRNSEPDEVPVHLLAATTANAPQPQPTTKAINEPANELAHHSGTVPACRELFLF